MAVRQMTDGQWQARWRDENGKQRAKKFQTKREATRFFNDVLSRRDGGQKTSFDSSMTVTTLAGRWLDASLQLRPRTIETYRRDLDAYILPRLGGIKMANLRPAMVQSFLADELATLAPSSVHRHYRTLHTMFNWAIRMEYLTANPCTAVNPPRVPKGEMTIFTVEQIEQIAANITPRYRVFVLLLAYGGLRMSEAVGIRRFNVDGTRVTIGSQLQKIAGKWVRTETKTTAGERTIVVPPSVADELATHMAEFTGPDATALVFTDRSGNPIGHSFRYGAWALACVKSGMGQREWASAKSNPNGPRHLRYRNIPHPHDLRHTSVALAIAAGAHPKTIQHRLGHSSISVTMDTYGHLFSGIDEALADDLDAMRLNRD